MHMRSGWMQIADIVKNTCASISSIWFHPTYLSPFYG